MEETGQPSGSAANTGTGSGSTRAQATKRPSEPDHLRAARRVQAFLMLAMVGLVVCNDAVEPVDPQNTCVTANFTGNCTSKEVCCDSGCVTACSSNSNCTGSQECDTVNCRACTTAYRCGDGVVTGNEECDDGNTAPGDGCSENCEIEVGCSNASDCAAGEDCCLGTCIDVLSDPANCGACDVVCPAGASCNGGNCECPPGQFDNGGACTSCSTCAPGTFESAACTQSSDSVCSPCNTACLTCSGGTASDCDMCNSGYYDDAGTCTACTTCPAGSYEETACGPFTDTICSSCDPACATCTGPTATDCLTCTAGYTDCSGLCTDTDIDLSNCGSCGNTCSAGETCSTGTCLSTTPGPTVDVITLVISGKHYPLTKGFLPQITLIGDDTECDWDHWHIFAVPACSIDGGPPLPPDFGLGCGLGLKIPGPPVGLVPDLGSPDAGGIPEAYVTVTQAELDSFIASSCGM